MSGNVVPVVRPPEPYRAETPAELAARLRRKDARPAAEPRRYPND